MGLIFQHGYLDFIAILLSTSVCIVIYFKWSFTYWKRRKVPYLKPRIPWGTFDNFLGNPNSFGERSLLQYQEAKQNGYKLIGLFGFWRPICMVLDPLLIKSMMVTDFKYFMNRGVYFNEKDDPLSAHLFSIEGAKWRNLRMKLTPTFTSGKMKMMFNILLGCGDQLKEAMNKISLTSESVDIKDVLARFTTNVIGSAAFGLECNTFTDVDSEFRKYGKKIFTESKLQSLKATLAFVDHDLGRRLRITETPKDASDFFRQIIKDTVEYREKNNIERKDFMQLLINLKNDIRETSHEKQGHENQSDGKNFSLDELSAQAFVFFIAGFETSSTTMTFCLFELAINPDIQEKVRNEVEKIILLYEGKLTYDAIIEMKYMGQVIDETLRKYPPLPVLTRKCNEDYKIVGTDFTIEEGTPIFIPIIGLQNDPEYFPDPEKFSPERFSEENKHNIRPYTYMPFGEGPRICIGLRFGVMQTKVGLAVLLQNFRFSLNAKTKMPLKMDPACFIQSTLGDIWLNVEKIKST